MKYDRRKSNIETWKCKELRSKHSRIMKEVANRPEVKAKKAESNRKRWQNPEFRRKVSAKISESMSGDRHWRWNNRSWSKYKGFNSKVKMDILLRDAMDCRNTLCNPILYNGKINHSRLEIHHIDYDGRNNDYRNLITLCGSCNQRANHNREFWTEHYQKLQKGQMYT